MPGLAREQERPVVVERARGGDGELVLRRCGEHHEIISNGVFLMDTRDGRSERLLVRAAVADLKAPVRVLVGGLGVGFSLAEAVTLPQVAAVTVVEKEPAVIAWHRTHLRHCSAGALEDPRVRVHCADLLEWLAGSPGRGPGAAGDATDGGAGGGVFDAVCLDIDNGPDWTVTASNARLYGAAGLDLVAARMSRRGVLAVWSAAAAPAFEELLRGRFAEVRVRRVPVPRGEPDVVYLARGLRDAAGA
ncbi:spermidine synthase [Actinomadura sp. NBRC 104425]|uniref:spermine/spermidine synthase domain-containing protein n=1 Tax=Actinomadura sp. NBRC 104425 TaxID=3032204 RepID=UPI0024A35469|nr:spermidine synthase [Actinomadura sp. NBRC 104425]GLZ11838.1 spermidine synthase [Actinomadura sp. NBRC 104425]